MLHIQIKNIQPVVLPCTCGPQNNIPLCFSITEKNKLPMWEDKEKMQSNDSSAHVTRFCEYKKKFPISSSAAFFFFACHCCWADTNKAHRKTCNHISISICCCLYYLDISMYMKKCLRIYTLLRTFQVSEKPPYQKPQRYTRQQHSLKMDWLQIEFWNCYQIHWTSMIQRGGGPASVFRL